MSEPEIYATLVELNKEPTELYKILKFENLVMDGAQAKQVIAEGYVYLNGVVETQKRKKVYAGDLVYFNEQYLQIALAGETQSYEFVDESLAETNVFEPQTEAVQAQQEQTAQPAPITRKKKPRKALKF